MTKTQIQINEFSTNICYTQQTQSTIDGTLPHYVVPAVICYVLRNWLFVEMVPEVRTHGRKFLKMLTFNLDVNWLKQTLPILTPWSRGHRTNEGYWPNHSTSRSQATHPNIMGVGGKGARGVKGSEADGSQTRQGGVVMEGRG